jgi:hypothetical protein
MKDARVVTFVGTMILASVLLSQLVNPWSLAIALFVGANLLQSAFTSFCLLAIILRRPGVPDPTPEDARAL